LPLESDLKGDQAQSLVDYILHRLSQSMGSNALCFTGNLTVTATVEADETNVRESLNHIEGKGLGCHVEPIRFLTSTEVM
jgi:hypothetical protein